MYKYMVPNTYLGQKGYSIYKNSISVEEQQFVRENLTVQPFTPKSIAQLPSFPIFRESNKKLYVPRHFGENTFGMANESKVNDGESINCEFNGDLRDYQKNIVNVYTNHIKTSGGGLLEIPCGRGKCLAKGTPILMHDGSIKNVEDVIVNDKLMGDDSTPRTVSTLAKGKEQMYEINMLYTDESYTVNESHILSLIAIYDFHNVKKGDIVDISVKDYINSDKSTRNSLCGYKVAVDYPFQNVEVHPYLFGYWLGSNNSAKLSESEFSSFLKKYNIIYNDKSTKIPEMMLNKQIPSHFIFNSKKARLNLLHGLIDATYSKNKITISKKDDFLKKQVFYLINSLGYSYKILDESTILVIKESMSEIDITKKEIDNYYGFEIDGNRRFLLGNCIVTHNTVIALNIITQLKQKTLVIVHKGFLLNQWVERIQQFIPSARVGKIQGPVLDIKDKDIVIGMLQSLSMKDYESEAFSSFGLTIVDECHHISSEVFCRSLFQIVTKYTLGLSATMQRKDGLTKVFKMFLGDIVYSEKREGTDNVLVKAIDFKVNDEEYDDLITDYRGNPLYSSMITKLCNYARRSEFIIKVMQDCLKENPDQQLLVLAHNKSILKYFEESIEHKQIASVGYYVGGMKEEKLKESEGKTIILATYAMASEALDIKTLTTLVMTTPKTDITQSVGRILRVKHAQPLIIDIIDQHEIFQNQWKKRKVFYMKNNYKIIHSDNKKYVLNQWDTVYEKGVVEPKTKKSKQGKCLIKL